MLLIITACINPNENVNNLVLRDSNTRFKQYMECLEYFIKDSIFDKIIFCDNSNATFDTDYYYNLVQKQKKKLEIISFLGNVSSVSVRGKGYGEAEILNYVFEHSRMMKNEKFFVKVTGRLTIKNVNSILKKIDEKNNYFLPLQKLFKESCKKIDTRFYGMRTDIFIRYFTLIGEEINEKDGVSLEHVFHEVIQRNNIKYSLIPRYPRYVGLSGSTGVVYHYARFKKLKNVIKDINIMIRNALKN